MTEQNANIVEIFSSAQGEGLYIGYKQIFIRFAGCNLSCNFCDTDFKPKDTAKIELNAGKEDFEWVKNPLDKDTIFYYLKKLDISKKLHHSISLTGGEPLLQIDFLKDFLTDNFAKHKYKIYLETNGTLYEDFNKIVKLIDIVSMDIKIPSSAKNKEELWQKHKKFLDVYVENKKSKIELFVKVVVNENFSDEELYNIIWCLSSSEADVPVIIQPQSNNPPAGSQLLEWQSRLLKHINVVRIIPQAHKILGVL